MTGLKTDFASKSAGLVVQLTDCAIAGATNRPTIENAINILDAVFIISPRQWMTRAPSAWFPEHSSLFLTVPTAGQTPAAQRRGGRRGRSPDHRTRSFPSPRGPSRRIVR